MRIRHAIGAAAVCVLSASQAPSLLAQETPDGRLAPVPLKASRRIEGRWVVYATGDGLPQRLTIARRGVGVTAQWDYDAKPTTLLPRGTNSFFIGADTTSRVVFAPSDSRALRVTIIAPNAPQIDGEREQPPRDRGTLDDDEMPMARTST